MPPVVRVAEVTETDMITSHRYFDRENYFLYDVIPMTDMSNKKPQPKWPGNDADYALMCDKDVAFFCPRKPTLVQFGTRWRIIPDYPVRLRESLWKCEFRHAHIRKNRQKYCRVIVQDGKGYTFGIETQVRKNTFIGLVDYPRREYKILYLTAKNPPGPRSVIWPRYVLYPMGKRNFRHLFTL